MKNPMKPRDKITQKMSRDGLTEQNQTTGETELISKRAQDAGLAPKHDAATAERVIEHIDGRHTRKASKKAARKAHAEAAAQTKTSRLQFTDEELNVPELEKYIRKSNEAADRLDAAKAAIPKKKVLTKERTFDEATGRGKTRLRFEEKEKPIPGGKPHKNPLSRPAQEAGIFVHNKIHSVEKDNSGVEGAHKSEEAAERLYRHCRAALIHHGIGGLVLLRGYVFRDAQRHCGNVLHVGGQRPCGGGKQLCSKGKRTTKPD